MELMELGSLKGSLVGLPGHSGLSVEQRKRLTIGVELVANPSIVFMVSWNPCKLSIALAVLGFVTRHTCLIAGMRNAAYMRHVLSWKGPCLCHLCSGSSPGLRQG